MLNCYQFKNLISNYIEGDISLKNRQEFEDHLKVCADCNKLYEQVLRNYRILHELPQVNVSDNFYFKLRNRIVSLRKKESEENIFPLFKPFLKLKSLPSYVYGFALAVVAIVITVVVLNIQGKESTESQIPPVIQSRLNQVNPHSKSPTINSDQSRNEAFVNSQQDTADELDSSLPSQYEDKIKAVKK